MDEDLKQTLAGIPPTAEELDNVRGRIAGEETKETLDKAYARNEKIIRAQRMVTMFKTEEFGWFWKMVHTEMEKMLDQSPRYLKGTPFEKLDQLATIQGGLEMLESQAVQREIVEKTAQGEMVDVAVLEEKLRVIKQNR